MVAKRGEGRSPKSVRNWLGVLHSLLSYAEKRDWIPSNPCRKVDFPRIEETDADIRFLAPEGVEALLRAVDLDHEWGPTEHALYRTAAMTGLRQGELLALRWRDVDRLAGRVRVRRNYVRGEFGAPKSRRSSRSVPMAETFGSGDLSLRGTSGRGTPRRTGKALGRWRGWGRLRLAWSRPDRSARRATGVHVGGASVDARPASAQAPSVALRLSPVVPSWT
jgi:integrase